MSLEGKTPRVFALPPGVPFARHFAVGFHARFGGDPLTIARARIFVNTRRAARAIEDALAEAAGGAGLLPRVALMPELHGDPLATDLPPAIPPLRRQLRLTRLVEEFLRRAEAAGERIAPLACAPDLAEALAGLMDRFDAEGVLPERLDGLLDGEDLAEGAAAHWQRTLSFVDIVRRSWPAIRAEEEGGAPDPSARQRAAIAALVAEWQAAPPDHPVIAAASTGSVGSTAELLAEIARLPQGAVVLPGFDPGVEPAVWDAAGIDHPAGIFRPLLDRLGLAPDAVRPWQAVAPCPRRELWAQALRPAPVTDHWHEKAPALHGSIGEATDGLTLLEAESPRHEAEAIAVLIREALETPGATAALVSPDAALARRVTAALDRFGILPDDTLGAPLALSPPAVLLRLIGSLAASAADAVTIAAALKHPLVRPGMPRPEHRRHAAAYERHVLRGVAARTMAGRLPAWPEPKPGRDRPPIRTPERAAWLAAVEAALAPLSQALASGAPLGQLAGALRRAAEALTDAGDGPVIWDGSAGEKTARVLDELEAHADAFGDGRVADFPALLLSLLHAETLRPEPERPHPRVTILGPREARVAGADVMILAGLNDGVWPAAADPGPWLSRPMCARLGLPLPEHSVGLAAHDFLQGACQPRAVLTRAARVEGTPTVASRWLIRLETLVEGVGAGDAMQEMRARGRRYLDIARRLSRPEETVPPARRPAPRPPVGARPRRLSVTQIETLIRDAYAIYAGRVLKLRPLEPLGRPAGPLERGTVVHELMDRFTGRTTAWPGIRRARDLLMQTADEVLAEEVPWPDLRRAWRARIERFADWFLAHEEARRRTATPLGTELEGSMELDLPNGNFTVRARADRIDRLPDGRAAIYDYKTGQPPTKKQINAGFHQQIHLQAAILAAGGFGELEAMETARGGYIGLTGSGDGGKESMVDLTAGEIDGHIAGIRRLLAAYDSAETPYVSLGRPQLARDGGDYDHLARRQEWWGEGE